jgi:hypothetical protein
MTNDDAGSAREADAVSSSTPPEPAPPELKSPATRRSGRSLRAAWRAWRRSRPFWGGLLLVLGGLELLALPLTGVFVRGAIKLVIYIGIGGVFGVLIGVLLIAAGIVVWVNPTHRVFYGIAGIVLGIVSFPASNLGGFLIGMLLAIIGGALAFAWAPVDPESVAAAPAGRASDDAPEERDGDGRRRDAGGAGGRFARHRRSGQGRVNAAERRQLHPRDPLPANANAHGVGLANGDGEPESHDPESYPVGNGPVGDALVRAVGVREPVGHSLRGCQRFPDANSDGVGERFALGQRHVGNPEEGQVKGEQGSAEGRRDTVRPHRLRRRVGPLGRVRHDDGFQVPGHRHHARFRRRG